MRRGENAGGKEEVEKKGIKFEEGKNKWWGLNWRVCCMLGSRRGWLEPLEDEMALRPLRVTQQMSGDLDSIA